MVLGGTRLVGEIEPSITDISHLLKDLADASMVVNKPIRAEDMMMAAISKLERIVWRIRIDRRAQDLIEYALAAGFVAVAASAFFPPAIAPTISTIFSKVVDVLPDVSSP